MRTRELGFITLNGIVLTGMLGLAVISLLQGDCCDPSTCPPTPTIVVTAPVGGDTWGIGTSVTIRWGSSNVNSDVVIELSRDADFVNNYFTWETITADTPNNGSYSWLVNGSPSSLCVIRITAIDGTASGTSAGTFTIAVVPPSITLTQPNSGVHWEFNTAHDITWLSTNVNNVKIELARDGVQFNETVVASMPASSRIYSWTVTGPFTTQARVRISSVDDPSISSTSLAFIIRPYLKISTYPPPQFISQDTGQPAPTTTINKTVVLIVQVNYGAGFPSGSELTYIATITARSQILYTLLRTQQTQQVQTSAGTVTFTFPLTVQNESASGRIRGRVSFLGFNSTSGGFPASINFLEEGDADTNVLTAKITSFAFDQHVVGQGVTTVNLTVQVEYNTDVSGDISVKVQETTFVPGVSAFPSDNTRNLHLYQTSADGTPSNGSVQWSIEFNNTATNTGDVWYQGSLLDPGGTLGILSTCGPPSSPLSTSSDKVTTLPSISVRASVLNPPVLGDGDAVVSGQPFTLQVEAVSPSTGQRVTSYNLRVTAQLIDPSPVPGESQTQQIPLSGGVGTAQLVIKVVPGTSPSRALTLSATYATPTGIYINVWFAVGSTTEFYRECDGTLSYGKMTACYQGGLPPNSVFVSLPSTSFPCERSVLVRNLDAGTSGSAPLEDRGPKTTSDPYWNTSGVPQFFERGIDLSDGFATQLSIPNGCIGSQSYGNAHVLWRFN